MIVTSSKQQARACADGDLVWRAAQRFIVRIIFMVPLYSLLSFLSLLMEHNSVYFDTFRDWRAPKSGILTWLCTSEGRLDPEKRKSKPAAVLAMLVVTGALHLEVQVLSVLAQVYGSP